MAKFYKCNICGNIINLIKNGGGELVCCGQPMQELKANTVDAAIEKHIPFVINKNEIQVGSIEHPMTNEHFIEWIYVIDNDNEWLHKFKPNQKPNIKFYKDLDGLEIYAYCNLHGLWKK